MSHPSARTAWTLLAVGCLAFAVYGSLVPFNFSAAANAGKATLFEQDLSLSGSKSDWGVNIILFVPISFCLLAAWAPPTWRWKVAAVIVVLAFCASATLVIELAQNWLPGRVASLSDVVAQLIGAGIGSFLWFVVGSSTNRWLENHLPNKNASSQLHRMLQLYLAGLVVYALMPMDLTIRPAEVYEKYKAGGIRWWPNLSTRLDCLNETFEALVNAILFAPVGVLAGLDWVTKRRRPLWLSLILGCGVVVCVAFGQIFVVSRPTVLADSLTAASGIVVGIWLLRLWQHDVVADGSTGLLGSDTKWFLIAVAYALVVAFLYWTPFDFMSDTEEIRRRMSLFFSLPLLAAIGGNRLVGISALMRKFAIFFPFGVFTVLVTRRMPPTSRRVLSTLLMAVVGCFALCLELGQILLPAHVASVDDVGLGLGAAGLGLAVTRRLLTAQPLST